jgi:predicted lipoprotein with Yx(FWY)xxD motif
LKDNNYQLAEWVASGQAKKLNKQIKKDAKGVTIRIYYEDDSGRSFCKLETIYNVAELENIQKIETTTNYKNMIERLKRA